MKAHHAAVPALVGWYLMMPPTQEALDSCCTGKGLCISSLIDRLRGTGAEENLKQCDREATHLVLDAPFSQWVQGGEYETLAECRADQQKPLTQQEKAWAGLAGALTAGSGVSKDDLIRTQEQALKLSKCLASDDPRLAK